MRAGLFAVVLILGALPFAACGKDKKVETAAPQASAPAGVSGAASPTSASLVKPTISSVSSPVKKGGKATVQAKAGPNQSCNLDYVAPGGTKSTASGLGAKTADASGSVSWTWTIGGNTNPGPGKLTVTCGPQTVTANIEITA